jgi:hypothetical protein
MRSSGIGRDHPTCSVCIYYKIAISIFPITQSDRLPEKSG